MDDTLMCMDNETYQRFLVEAEVALVALHDVPDRTVSAKYHTFGIRDAERLVRDEIHSARRVATATRPIEVAEALLSVRNAANWLASIVEHSTSKAARNAALGVLRPIEQAAGISDRLLGDAEKAMAV